MRIKYIEIIIRDFKAPVLSLIPTLLFSAVAVAIVGWGYNKSHPSPKHYNRGKAVVWVLLLSYAMVVLQTAFLSREPGSRKKVSLTLFETWGNTLHMHAFFIENIIMFIPFGVLSPILFKSMRKAWSCVLAGFLCSGIIEVAQLITQRGYLQLDDVVTNTAGTLIGWLAWKGVLRHVVKN